MKKKVLSAVLACAATMALTTCAFADAPASQEPGATDSTTVGGSDVTPGDSDKTIEVEVEIGEITAEGLEGDALNAKLFTGDAEGKTWKDVVSVTFKSDDKFGVGFTVKKGAVKGDADAEWFQMGSCELAKALTDDELSTEWTLGEDEIAALNASATPSVKLAAADGSTATVTATITLKEKAADTGIALAIAPAGLAVAFVTVAAVMSKKKKG